MTLILFVSEKWSGHGLASLTGSYGPINKLNTVKFLRAKTYLLYPWEQWAI